MNNASTDRLVLVVEPGEQMGRLLSSFLGDAGFTATLVDNADAALEAAHSQKPHVVITEILLQPMNGIEFCKRMRSEPELADVPILLFSAFLIDQGSFKGYADAFLAKPASAQKLIEVLNGLLSARGQ